MTLLILALALFSIAATALTVLDWLDVRDEENATNEMLHNHYELEK